MCSFSYTATGDVLYHTDRTSYRTLKDTKVHSDFSTLNDPKLIQTQTWYYYKDAAAVMAVIGRKGKGLYATCLVVSVYPENLALEETEFIAVNHGGNGLLALLF